MVHYIFIVFFIEIAQLLKKQKHNCEVQFMACSIIYSFIRTETIFEVDLQFNSCIFIIFSQKRTEQFILQHTHCLFMPCFVCFVSKPHWLFNRWNLTLCNYLLLSNIQTISSCNPPVVPTSTCIWTTLYQLNLFFWIWLTLAIHKWM